MSHHVQVIAADGEMRASLALAEASGVIHNSPAAIKLRHLQVCTVTSFFKFAYMGKFR